MKRHRSFRPHLECLETRLVPAKLLSPTQLLYQDKDGDSVTVTHSKAILNAGNVNMIFTFDSGAGAVNGTTTTKEALQRINLSAFATAAGMSINVNAIVSAVNGGDGFANVGELNAAGDLGTVTIDGDLGRILAGDAVPTTIGLAALNVQSIGRYGAFTGAMNLNSIVVGRLGALNVKADIKEAYLEVQGGASADIGAINIGGSLVGGVADNTGRIYANDSIGFLNIKGDLKGSDGLDFGAVRAEGLLGPVKIGGSLFGGIGDRSGSVRSLNSIGAVAITGSVHGGDGEDSGNVFASFNVAAVSVGGSLIGGLWPGVLRHRRRERRRGQSGRHQPAAPGRQWQRQPARRHHRQFQGERDLDHAKTRSRKAEK